MHVNRKKNNEMQSAPHLIRDQLPRFPHKNPADFALSFQFQRFAATRAVFITILKGVANKKSAIFRQSNFSLLLGNIHNIHGLYPRKGLRS